MEAWQVLLLKQRTPKPASSTENAQVVGSHSGEPAKEGTISWSMEPMIPSQRAELNCHHEDHIQHKHPKIGLSRARKKTLHFPYIMFFWLRVTFYRPFTEKKLDHRCLPVAFMGGMKYS
jgi:hypothetical protein